MYMDMNMTWIYNHVSHMHIGQLSCSFYNIFFAKSFAYALHRQDRNVCQLQQRAT